MEEWTEPYCDVVTNSPIGNIPVAFPNIDKICSEKITFESIIMPKYIFYHQLGPTDDYDDPFLACGTTLAFFRVKEHSNLVTTSPFPVHTEIIRLNIIRVLSYISK